MTSTVAAAAVQAAVEVAAGLGVAVADPAVLNDGANVIGDAGVGNLMTAAPAPRNCWPAGRALPARRDDRHAAGR